eukprot:gene11008-biopygen8705
MLPPKDEFGFCVPTRVRRVIRERGLAPPRLQLRRLLLQRRHHSEA